MHGSDHTTPLAGETRFLQNGRPLRLRPIRPSDRQRIHDCFQRLSPQSRYRRFLATKVCLSDQELDFFSQCPGPGHLALGALRLDWGLEQELVGAARLVPLTGDGRLAEMALVVADDHQNQGLGTLLLERLLVLAARAGIERLQAHVLTDNLPMRRLLSRYWGSSPDCWREGEVLVLEFPVLPPQLPPARTPPWLTTLPWLWPCLWQQAAEATVMTR